MSLDLPLCTAGLSVGVGIQKEPPALALPLATSGLSTAVGGTKPREPQTTAGDSLQLPLSTSGLMVGMGVKL